MPFLLTAVNLMKFQQLQKTHGYKVQSNLSAFPRFLAGVSHRGAGIGLGISPIPWFA